jgi:hypothetical protein
VAAASRATRIVLSRHATPRRYIVQTGRTSIEPKLAPGQARRPREGRVEVGDVEQVEAAELLFGLRVGAVQDLGLAAVDPDGRRRGRRPQAIAREQDPAWRSASV